MAKFSMNDSRITPPPYVPPTCECGNRMSWGDVQCKSCKRLSWLQHVEEQREAERTAFNEEYLLWKQADHGERLKCACCGRIQKSSRIRDNKKYCPPCEEHIHQLIMSL